MGASQGWMGNRWRVHRSRATRGVGRSWHHLHNWLRSWSDLRQATVQEDVERCPQSPLPVLRSHRHSRRERVAGDAQTYTKMVDICRSKSRVTVSTRIVRRPHAINYFEVVSDTCRSCLWSRSRTMSFNAESIAGYSSSTNWESYQHQSMGWQVKAAHQKFWGFAYDCAQAKETGFQIMVLSSYIHYFTCTWH